MSKNKILKKNLIQPVNNNKRFAFLNVATTNLYASALAVNSKDPEASKSAGDAVVRTAVKSSLFCGFGLLTLLLSASRKLLSIYIGSSSSNKVLEPANRYVTIRAFSMPTSLLAGVLQAALLGAKDSVTPLYAVLASTIINIAGDLLEDCSLIWHICQVLMKSLR